MDFDDYLTREVIKFINYFAGQANAVKTMTQNKRTCEAITQMLLSAVGTGDNLFLHYSNMLQDTVIDITNTILDHPCLDDETRSKVYEIRVSANRMELFQLAKTIDELLLLQNQLT